MAKLYPLYPAVLGQIAGKGSEGGEGKREGEEERREKEKGRGRKGEERREVAIHPLAITWYTQTYKYTHLSGAVHPSSSAGAAEQVPQVPRPRDQC